MDQCPQEPCEHALQARPAEIKDGGLPSDNCGVPAIVEFKVRRRSTGTHFSHERPAKIIAFLLSHLRKPR